MPDTLFWPLIRNRVRCGHKLPPEFYATNVNNALKAFLKKLDFAFADRYSSRAFRRGPANELKCKGSQRPTIAALGGMEIPIF